VRATPIRIEREDLTVMVMVGISGEKRRDTLERLFFHDIMNTIGGLRDWSRMLLNDIDNPAPERAAERICALTERLLDEIEGQRQLLSAEKGDLVVSRENTPVSAILEQLRAIFSAHETTKNRTLDIADAGGREVIDTDPSLVIRVLTNMVKNALEATDKGGIVRVWHDRSGDEHVFHVWNPGGIKQEVALQIFQRTFSTKGEQGRGIGTYSMKLFGERYLGGKVAFESTREKGTDFTLRLPHMFLCNQDGPSSN